MKQRLLLCVLFALLTGLDPAPTRAESPAAPSGGPVYVIPVKGMIEPALLYVMRRGVQEAESEGAAAVVLLMDTPGGRLDAATDIVRLMQGVRVPTYTFVEKNAISAGAIIALSTKDIYMAPGSVIGDAMPIMMSPTGGAQEMPEAIEEKTVSAVAALIRAAAQKSGHDPQLAEAMVRRELEYKIGDEVISPAGQLLTLTNVEAEREVGPEGERRKLLSKGTVADIPALLEQIGLAGRPVRELEVTSTERLARMIAAAAPLLLMAGLLGIYIEFKTPGFGLPGLLGLAALALFFWGHHIAGLAGMEEMLVFLVGLLLIALEVFILPGFGVPGIAGIVLVLYALLHAMMDKLPEGQWLPSVASVEGPLRTLSIAIVGSFVGAVAIGRFLPHSPARRWLVLAQSTDTKSGYTAAPQQTDLVGQRGTTITALRPAGTAQFGERRLDVVTEGLFVDPGTPVRIASVHGSRIVVELDRTAT